MNLKYVRTFGAIALTAGAIGFGAVHCSSNGSGTNNGPDAGGSTADGGIDTRTAMLLARGQNVTKPITDVHVHLFQPSRPGVEWPAPANATLYRDTLPALAN